MAPASISSTRGAMSSCRQSARSAEQRCPAERNEDRARPRPPARAARRIDQHGALAAGFGDQRHDRPVLGGERAVDRPGGPGRAGERDPGDARIRHQPRAHPARRATGRAHPRARRPGAAGRPPWPRSAGSAALGQHRVADRQGGDLAGEDGDGGVPPADRDERAAAVQGEAIARRRSAPATRAARPWPAPPWRSSAGNPPPRAPRRPHRAGSCRPRARTRRAAQPRSPRTGRLARRRHSTRSASGVRSSGKPGLRCAHRQPDGFGIGSITLPTAMERSAGSSTARASPRPLPMPGRASKPGSKAAPAAPPAGRGPRGSRRSMPRALRRSEP